MKTTPGTLVGLNILRASAIFMMVMAHAIRTQSNFPLLMQQRNQASLLDSPLLWIIDIEPIISVLFLFIAGFSLTLSFTHRRQTNQAWLLRMYKRCAQLYGVAVLFFLAEHGFQWPDFLVSPGILSIIAVALALTASCLVCRQPALTLTLSACAVMSLTAVLESQHWAVTGLNAGAGGLFPLLSVGPIGSLVGLAYLRWQDNGLITLFGISLVIAAFSLALDSPWVYRYNSEFIRYSSQLWQQWWISAQALVTPTLEGTHYVARYWNHAAIFPLRVTALLILVTLLFLKLFSQTKSRSVAALNFLGTHALSVYILHLVLLAGIEVSGLKPSSAWQTWLLIASLLTLSSLTIVTMQRGVPRLRRAVNSLDPDTAAH
jgi:hypothetical protein